MKLPIYSEKLRKPNVRQWPLMIRHVRNHSMVPVLPPGTIVWAITWYMTLVVGDVVIFEYDGKENIKRISAIKNNKIFLRGDYEDDSRDSRHFGWIPMSRVRGRVIYPKAHKPKF